MINRMPSKAVSSCLGRMDKGGLRAGVLDGETSHVADACAISREHQKGSVQAVHGQARANLCRKPFIGGFGPLSFLTVVIDKVKVKIFSFCWAHGSREGPGICVFVETNKSNNKKHLQKRPVRQTNNDNVSQNLQVAAGSVFGSLCWWVFMAKHCNNVYNKPATKQSALRFQAGTDSSRDNTLNKSKE